MTIDDEFGFVDNPTFHKLLGHKLGTLLTWTRPRPEQSVGPFDLAAFDPFSVQRNEMIAVCLEKVRSYSEDQIAEIVSATESIVADAHGWSRFKSDEINSLKRRTPPWYAGGFGHPDYTADFDYWTKMPKFDLGELTCLTVGIGPERFTWPQLQDLSTSKDRPQFWRPLEFLVKRYEQLNRKFALCGRSDTVGPSVFVAWAEQVDFEVHPRFLEPLKRYNLPRGSTEEVSPQRKPDKREIDKIAQLFTAMAIEQFGYVPGQARNTTTSDISSLAASLGLQITQETILKYLRHGATFISAEWKPHER